MAGIRNHGTMAIYVNSQVPGLYEAVPVPVGDTLEPPDAPPHCGNIKEHEGLELKPYKDIVGKTHIGYGRNLDDKGITKDEAEILFENDLIESWSDLSENVFPDEWPRLPGGIKSVLVNMRYQMGPFGFRGFTDMIRAVRAKDWHSMAEEMRRSKWAEQTPGRAKSLIRIVDAIGIDGN